MHIYRATTLAEGKSSTELYLKRNLRIGLDVIKPFYEQQRKCPRLTGLRSFKVEDRVLLQLSQN